ncbi:MAG: glycoside hydrolase, partial [Candidatus Pacebacteria bacterium]|nr:glycoside hydrolase [Candidatus Paceibacterota bacterium]
MSAHAVRPIANDFVTMYESPDPRQIYCYSPGIERLASGRLVASLDIGGPGVEALPGEKFLRRNSFGRCWLGKIFTSDDKGLTWLHRSDFPFMHARPFAAGKSVYILGQADDLMIIRSDDEGATWSPPSRLSDGETWGQAPCGVHYAHGCIYVVMENAGDRTVPGWSHTQCAAVLMRARLHDDLTRRESWTFASPLTVGDVVRDEDLDFFGVPFYPTQTQLAPGRGMCAMHWGETHVVRFTDPDHLWCNTTGKTFHLWARALTGTVGHAAVLKVVEQGEQPGTGPMQTMVETAPSGKKMLFAPCPGGQMKFHVLQDPITKLYWLLSTQATDSMCRMDRMPAERFNIPNDERRRLQLHFSKNMIDWCFAGLVAVGPVEKASRHYASMVIDGNDLCVLSR